MYLVQGSGFEFEVAQEMINQMTFDSSVEDTLRHARYLTEDVKYVIDQTIHGSNHLTQELIRNRSHVWDVNYPLVYDHYLLLNSRTDVFNEVYIEDKCICYGEFEVGPFFPLPNDIRLKPPHRHELFAYCPQCSEFVLISMITQ